VPSKKKAGQIALLVYVLAKVHEEADTRRRAERLTWAKLIATLLTRYAAGNDDQALSAPVRRPRQLAPDSVMRADVGADIHRVDPASITWHRGLGGYLRAEAAHRGKVVPAEVLRGLDNDNDGDDPE